MCVCMHTHTYTHTRACVCHSCTHMHLPVHTTLTRSREVEDRDQINEFLRNEIRMSDMREKVTKELSEEGQGSESNDKKVDVLIQREQTIEQLQRLLEEAITEKDRVTTELE